MGDNISAFRSDEYDQKIKQTIPYYEDFYRQIMELVKACHFGEVNWLDAGCGTGKMAACALQEFAIKRFVFLDSSEEMLAIAKRHFTKVFCEFQVGDVCNLPYRAEFEVVTAVQVNHYLQREERRTALQNYCAALKDCGIYIAFENFAPYTDRGRKISLERWKEYQQSQGKSAEEAEKHISRYGKDYFPISLTEQLSLMRECGFQTAEILWVSGMQAGIWGMK
jgi:tRNA (cmo5U34)-methyltransferase